MKRITSWKECKGGRGLAYQQAQHFLIHTWVGKWRKLVSKQSDVARRRLVMNFEQLMLSSIQPFVLKIKMKEVELQFHDHSMQTNLLWIFNFIQVELNSPKCSNYSVYVRLRRSPLQLHFSGKAIWHWCVCGFPTWYRHTRFREWE